MIGNSVSGFEHCSAIDVSPIDDTRMFVKVHISQETLRLGPPFLLLTHSVCDAVYKHGIYIEASAYIRPSSTE